MCIYTFNVWKLNQNITTYTHKNVHYITELYFHLQMVLKFEFLLSILLSISNQLPECRSEDTAKNKLIKTMMKNLTKLKAKTWKEWQRIREQISNIQENPTTINQLIKSNIKIEKYELSPSVDTVPFLVRKTKCVGGKKKEKKKETKSTKLSTSAD